MKKNKGSPIGEHAMQISSHTFTGYDPKMSVVAVTLPSSLFERELFPGKHHHEPFFAGA